MERAAGRARASTSSPLTWKMGALSALATSVQYALERLLRGSVVKATCARRPGYRVIPYPTTAGAPVCGRPGPLAPRERQHRSAQVWHAALPRRHTLTKRAELRALLHAPRQRTRGQDPRAGRTESGWVRAGPLHARRATPCVRVQGSVGLWHRPAGRRAGARLVVDDQVDGAADGVVRQRAHVQRLIHHALRGARRAAGRPCRCAALQVTHGGGGASDACGRGAERCAACRCAQPLAAALGARSRGVARGAPGRRSCRRRGAGCPGCARARGRRCSTASRAPCPASPGPPPGAPRRRSIDARARHARSRMQLCSRPRTADRTCRRCGAGGTGTASRAAHSTRAPGQPLVCGGVPGRAGHARPPREGSGPRARAAARRGAGRGRASRCDGLASSERCTRLPDAVGRS